MNKKFVRLNELASLYSEKVGSYFHRSRDNVINDEIFEEQYLLIENELCELDIDSWNFLKEETGSLCTAINGKRGWSPLFDKLNEAKGYCFLKSIEYSIISFIPRAKINGIETPDLMGWRDTSQALCEVKTIHVSDDLIAATENMTVFTSQDTLTSGLRKKLEYTFNKATSQINSYTEFTSPEKFIYLIIEYDDGIFFNKEFNEQTRELFNTMSLTDINLLIHNEKK